MATRIYLRNGLGKPEVSDFGGSTGELLIDLQDNVIWTLDQAGVNVVMLGSDISSETIDWEQLDNVPTEFEPKAHNHIYDEVKASDGKTLTVEVSEIHAAIADIVSEIGSLQGNLTFGGTVAMSTQSITSLTAAGTDKGFVTGPIPPAPPLGSENIYFIAENGGSFDGGTFTSGDWLVSEGQEDGWAGIHFDSTILITWDEIGSKPTVFPPADHIHAITDIINLQDVLDDKAQVGHTHTISEIGDLQSELDSKASVLSISGGTY